MSRKTISVQDKQVLVSRPYRPNGAAVTEAMVGREAEMRLVTAAWMGGRHSLPLSPLLLGEPGVGKNRLVYEMARRTGKDLYIFQGHEDVTAEDLACTVRFSDDPDKKMDYVISPLVTAMCQGAICFIDEIAKIRPRALAMLASVLDERRYIDSTLLGERVTAKPGFRFIAATNTADLEGNSLPEFILSRMRPRIHLGFPPKEEILQIIGREFPLLDGEVPALLDCFWSSWETLNSGKPPTPRDAIYVFSVALSIADLEAMEEPAKQAEAHAGNVIALDSIVTAPAVTPRHLELAFAELSWENGGVKK